MILQHIENRPSCLGRRPGVTLTEVLIAIFVMGIGMLSLLALFPLGIQNTAAAIRNNRLASAAANAENVAELFSIRNEPLIMNALQAAGMVNASYSPMNFSGDGPGPAVLVDPIGFEVFGPLSAVGRVTGLASNFACLGIPRATVTGISGGTGLARRWFSQEDDVGFDTFGRAGVPQPVERERKYSWAYLWRRPRYGEPKVAELTILLYTGRKLQFSNLASPAGEDLYTGAPIGTNPPERVFKAGSNTATLYLGTNPVPAVKPGDWVFDATTKLAAAGDPRVILNSYFYRVAEVSDPYVNQAGRVVELTLLTPAKADGYVAVLMAGLVDVIEKGDGRMPAN